MEIKILLKRLATDEEIKKMRDVYALMNASDPKYKPSDVMISVYFEGLFPNGEKVCFFSNTMIDIVDQRHSSYEGVMMKLEDGILIPQAEDYICAHPQDKDQRKGIN